VNPADPDGVLWLETIAASCERVLAREEADPADPRYRHLRRDVEQLLARVKADLAQRR
jgi:hypothetical protein